MIKKTILAVLIFSILAAALYMVFSVLQKKEQEKLQRQNQIEMQK